MNNNNNNNNRIIIQGREIEILRERRREGDGIERKGELEEKGEREEEEMSSERVPVELCKGINGLEKVVLREVRGSSAEVIG